MEEATEAEALVAVFWFHMAPLLFNDVIDKPAIKRGLCVLQIMNVWLLECCSWPLSTVLFLLVSAAAEKHVQVCAGYDSVPLT